MLKNLGLYHASKVSDMVENDRWKWPEGRTFSAEVKQFYEVTPDTVLKNSHKEDQVCWRA